MPDRTIAGLGQIENVNDVAETATLANVAGSASSVIETDATQDRVAFLSAQL